MARYQSLLVAVVLAVLVAVCGAHSLPDADSRALKAKSALEVVQKVCNAQLADCTKDMSCTVCATSLDQKKMAALATTSKAATCTDVLKLVNQAMKPKSMPGMTVNCDVAASKNKNTPLTKLAKCAINGLATKKYC